MKKIKIEGDLMGETDNNMVYVIEVKEFYYDFNEQTEMKYAKDFLQFARLNNVIFKKDNIYVLAGENWIYTFKGDLGEKNGKVKI